MTAPAPRHDRYRRPEFGVRLPDDDTPVLLNRELVAGSDPAALSRFGDHRWHLNAAIHEADASAISLQFADIPAPLRLTAKHYVWQVINTDCPVAIHRSKVSRYSIASVRKAAGGVAVFLRWLHRRHVTELSQVTADLLDDYLTEIARTAPSLRQRYSRVTEVRRLWAYRSTLPEPMRLPEPFPWGPDGAQELFGKAIDGRENHTRRIAENTMQALLAWSLRFVEDFADDIITAYTEYCLLQGRASGKYREAGQVMRRPPGQINRCVTEYLDRLRSTGATLPGRLAADGSVQLDWEHLGRILEYRSSNIPRQASVVRALLDSGIPIADAAYLEAPITGRFDDGPWRDRPITHFEAPVLARHLSTAAAVIIAYLSGARPSEVLNLSRNCIRQDPETGLWCMTGIYFKGARDDAGNKLPGGAPRRDPWVVVEPVAISVAVLERLHDHQLLFPNRFDHKHNTLKTRVGGARTAEAVRKDLKAFLGWVDDYCRDRGIHGIPADRHGTPNMSRFRRTLAWHIRRRSRGVVAGAIQYGHVGTWIFQGYAGTYESGFPDEYAFEDFLAYLEELGKNHRALEAGEKVSGPAADTYRLRVAAAHKQFAGHVLTTDRQARDLLGNSLLQIFHGQGMTCVFDPTKAACQLRGNADDPRVTPDMDDCRPRCPNIARTDRDIAEIQRSRDKLAVVVADPLAPPIRHQREQHELARLDAILENHQ